MSSVILHKLSVCFTNNENNLVIVVIIIMPIWKVHLHVKLPIVSSFFPQSYLDEQN